MQDLLATSQVMFSFMSLLLFLNIISILGFIAAISNATCAVTKKGEYDDHFTIFNTNKKS